jgi:threonine dehydratase
MNRATTNESNTQPIVGDLSGGQLLSAIRAAAGRIGESVWRSPCQYSAALSAACGQKVHLKLENLQMTGSYKERGALNKILLLTPEQRAHGVITASAGNHAQGVAYHAGKLGVRATIVMPTVTPLVKVMATQGYGAEVILEGPNYDAAYKHALDVATQRKMTFLHPFDDLDVIAGQGTIGLEILDQVPEIEAAVIPVGGGGLIAGIACALKEQRPGIKIVGVQTSRLPSMVEAVKHHAPVTTAPASTVADGIAVRRCGDVTLPLVLKYVDEMVAVEEEEIASAILTLLEKEKTLAEGAGAAATAALLQHKAKLPQGLRTVSVVSGGNIDVSLLSRIIERGLVKDGRLVRVRIHLPDRPGALTEISAVIAAQRANIVELKFDRAYYGVNLGDTAIDVTMETRGAAHLDELMGAIKKAGYVHERIH